jgi:hypothetical protein
MNLLKRVSASVVLAAPLLFSANAFAGAHTSAKAATSAPSVDFSGQIGLTYFNLDEKGFIAFDGAHHPEFQLTAHTKILGMDTAAFFSVKTPSKFVVVSSGNVNAQGKETIDIDQFVNLDINRVGFIAQSQIGSFGAGFFETSSSQVMKNNYSPVHYVPGGIVGTAEGFMAYDNGQDLYLRPVGAYAGDYSGQGKAMHLSYTSPSFAGFTAGLDFVPAAQYKGYDGDDSGSLKTVQRSSVSASMGYKATMNDIKVDLRGSYSNKLNAYEFSGIANPRYELYNASLAVGMGGTTASVAYATKEYNFVNTDGTKATLGSGHIKPHAIDATLGHSLSMGKGQVSGLLSYTRSEGAGVGFTSVFKTRDNALANVVNADITQSSKFNAVGAAIQYDESNVSISGKMSHVMVESEESNSAGDTYVASIDESFNLFSLGASYKF